MLKIWNFTHLKLCLKEAIHSFKWVKLIQICQKEVKLFWYVAHKDTFYTWQLPFKRLI